MWNFAGRQNDIQGHGELANGNWISGIPLSTTPDLEISHSYPTRGKTKPTTNTISSTDLGIVGLLYQYSETKKIFGL